MIVVKTTFVVTNSGGNENSIFSLDMKLKLDEANEKLMRSLVFFNPELFWETVGDMMVKKIKVQRVTEMRRLFQSERFKK